MKIDERDAVLDQIDQIKQYSIIDEIGKHYPNENDIESISIGRYPVDKFVKFFNNAILFLEAELNTDNFYFYPIQAAAQPIANINLSITLSTILSHLQNNAIPQIPGVADQLITYENYFGFWRLSSHKVHDIDEEKVNDMSEKVKLLANNLKKNIERINSEIEQLSLERKEINEYVNTKKTELESISQSLQSVKVTVQEIETLKSNAVNKETEISGLINNINDKITLVQSEIKSYQDSFGIIEGNWKKLEKSVDSNNESAKNNFELSKQYVEFVESRKDQIEKLTGMAADGALGSKFHDREGKLTDKIPFWRNAIIGMTIVSIIWVVIVFTCIPATFKNEWVNLGVNLLKTAPAFILLGFVFKQYSKERNLEEEYAFKSAVAMTLTAYSQMLSEKDIEGNKSRQEMLLKTIEQLYTQPTIHNEKPDRLFSFNTKNLKESVANLTEAINNIKTK